MYAYIRVNNIYLKFIHGIEYLRDRLIDYRLARRSGTSSCILNFVKNFFVKQQIKHHIFFKPIDMPRERSFSPKRSYRR